MREKVGGEVRSAGQLNVFQAQDVSLLVNRKSPVLKIKYVLADGPVHRPPGGAGAHLVPPDRPRLSEETLTSKTGWWIVTIPWKLLYQ